MTSPNPGTLSDETREQRSTLSRTRAACHGLSYEARHGNAVDAILSGGEPRLIATTWKTRVQPHYSPKYLQRILDALVVHALEFSLKLFATLGAARVKPEEIEEEDDVEEDRDE
ncbi:MAG TPA: hypothetical protein VKS24_13020 [Bradyrhizobium sp.]|nr:hypothetical protein [Bradyrhizobium sp.]